MKNKQEIVFKITHPGYEEIFVSATHYVIDNHNAKFNLSFFRHPHTIDIFEDTKISETKIMSKKQLKKFAMYQIFNKLFNKMDKSA